MGTFAQRVKYLRENKGWTQDELAEKLGVSRPTVAGYESDSKSRIPRKETLSKIADVFEVTVDYLLGLTDNPNINKINSFNLFTEKGNIPLGESLSKMRNTKEIDVLERNKIGEKIKRIRETVGFSKLNIAKKLNITTDTIDQYESNNKYPSDPYLQLLSKLSGLTITDILTDGELFTDDNDDEYDPETQKIIYELGNQIQKVKDPKSKKKLLNMLKSLAESFNQE